MPTKVEKVRSIKTIKFISFDKLLWEKETRTVVNPFSNLLEMLECYCSIADKQDMERLKIFVKKSQSEENDSYINHLDMYSEFVTSMFWNSINPDEENNWMNFDIQRLEEILQNPFFTEYNLSRKQLEKAYKRKYPMLDVYSFFELEAYATTIFPKEELWDINTIWVYKDWIQYLYKFGWYEMIATVYKSYGIHWFSNNGENDPIMYKWACYAVSACQKCCAVSENALKKDLNNIYKELLIAFTIRGTLEKNSEIIDYVQECINKFDEEKMNILLRGINRLQEENKQLIDEKKQLNEGKRLLYEQLRELQNADDEAEDEKIEKIAYRIYCLSPQTEEMDNNVERFKKIWTKLDRSTKKDLKLSISMFENFESFDLALFPMIRSLEHEFSRNFFEPFQDSENYKNAGTPICTNRFYEKTHDALVKKKNSHPTMGNIPFIGRAVSDKKALEASNIIKAFRAFLGESTESFIKICKLLDAYRFGTKQYKLVQIRNAIAHGDDQITSSVDKECYEEVSKLLYEPPFQILFEVINHSVKK